MALTTFFSRAFLIRNSGYLLQFQANQPQGLKVIVSFDAAPSATEKQQPD
ncbi:hypothetical protein [Acinetobacter towneri]